MDSELFHPRSQELPNQARESSISPIVRRPSNGHGPLPPRIRRRNRLITSCLECRRRKLKCNKSHPCSNCTKFVRDCVFLAPALDPASQLKLAEIKEKMGSLERTLEDDVARRGRSSSIASIGGLQMSGLSESSDDEPAGPEDEKDLEPTPLAFTDAAYYEDADDDLLDLGVQIGKMRLTERVGGFVRPKFSQEIAYVLNRAEDANGDVRTEFTSPVQPGMTTQEVILPGNEFLTPSSSFFFAPEPQSASFMAYLPSKNVADRLMGHYWASVHQMCRVVHRPSFERQYRFLWRQVQSGIEPPTSFQALFLATMLSAVTSMSEGDVLLQFGVEKKQLVDGFQTGSETALYRANFLRTTKLQTLQALVMYLIPLCRREVTRSHSALCGAAIRLAECMGLHRDGTHYSLEPVEVHVRRIIWYQLCFLDIRTCESTGPRPQIHREDFDTQFPLNVNDEDLESANPPIVDSEKWTDMTMSRLRFEINEMHRFLWMERPRLERKKTTLTAVLSKVQQFINGLDKRFMPMFDKETPVHNMALITYKLLTLRMHVMVLHRYSSNHNRKMPERLRKILLTSGVQQVECAIMIETAPSLRPWSWYCGALHQYHTALLLLSELYATDVRYHEDRIWTCLDYVFEINAQLPRIEKSRLILREVIQKTEIYQSLRRVRAPKELEEHMAETVVSKMRTLSPEMPTAPVASGTGNLQRSAEYRLFNPNIADHAYYAPPHGIHPVPTASTTSPQGSDANGQDFGGQGASLGSSTSPGDLDIDWNEWDKLFPPDLKLNDLVPLPDFQFSTHFHPIPM
ncbi:hypothetical protein EJ08DRAFT_38324 [Tothia fuscella]|uniref:Zn(2)-C6 fungal-type domain-containing protein n=1 Tax=Tothia fuscella TaxID=1048955 RepID=A0A9P4NXU3_9PEZI|nr:hypothetical protein EJ08DRAFT_38324 [Tothia fuscella]